MVVLLAEHTATIILKHGICQTFNYLDALDSKLLEEFLLWLVGASDWLFLFFRILSRDLSLWWQWQSWICFFKDALSQGLIPSYLIVISGCLLDNLFLLDLIFCIDLFAKIGNVLCVRQFVSWDILSDMDITICHQSFKRKYFAI